MNVTDEMVRRAALAYEIAMDGDVLSPEVPTTAMREALEAAILPELEAMARDAGRLDWRWQYRFVTMMRAMDHGLSREDAEKFADNDVASLERAAKDIGLDAAIDQAQGDGE